MNIKNHNFYDSGVYELGKTNEATAYGLGIQAQRKITKRIGLSFGYGISLADSIKETEGYTRNAVYHQIEGNITLQPQNYKRIKPYVLTGYALNIIPQLKTLNEPASGLNINVGGGVEIKVIEHLGIAYQTTYGFSLAPSIPYNFKHQVGVVLYPSKFLGRSPKKVRGSATTPVIELAELDSLKMVADSLQEQLTIAENNNKQLGNSLNPTRNLEEEVMLLELENQLLLQELRSHRSVSDSIYTKSFDAYTLIGKDGQVLAKEASSISPGFYIITDKKYTLPEITTLCTAPFFANLGTLHYLNKEDMFVAIAYVGEDREAALATAQSSKEKGIQVSVVRIP